MVKIKVILGDITGIEADAIANPANSLGIMGGGVAKALKIAGGEEIEKEATSKAPIPVGSAIATTAGRLKAKYVIHAPTMERPAGYTSYDHVYKAVKAALKVASEKKIKSIAFPGFGTGIGGLDKNQAAETMIKAIEDFVSESSESSIELIYLVARDLGLYNAFTKALGSNEKEV